MIRDYLHIAFNAILQRKLRSYLTMIGVFIGIAAVVSLIGLGEGLREAVMGQFGSFSPDILTVQAGGIRSGPPGSGVVNPLTVDDVNDLKGITGVKNVIPRLIRTSNLKYNDYADLGYIASLPPGEERDIVLRIFQITVAEGKMISDRSNAQIVVGANFAEENDNRNPIHIGQDIEIEGKSFEVIGITKKKGSFMFDNLIMMNEKVMRSLYSDNKKVDLIAVIVKDIKEVDSVKERIEKKMRQIRNVKKGQEDFSVESPQNTLKTIDDTLFAIQLFIYIIAGISLLVGGIGIMNTMYTAVLERTKEIGIMKAIGAKKSSIFVQFFIESGFMGLIGGLIGIITGVGLASGLAFIGTKALGSNLLQAHFSPVLLIGALAFSFLLGSIAGIIPALQAAKLNPVDALRSAK